MGRRFQLILSVTVLASVCACGIAEANESLLLAQSDEPSLRGPGGYLAWYKLLLVAVPFLVWVRMTDWINRDAQAFGKDIGLLPEVWNPISMVAFLLGFWSAVSIPIFWVGFPLMLLLAFAPFTTYFLIRRSKIIETPSLRHRINSEPDAPEVLPQDDGPAIKFTPAGNSNADKQKNLITARQAEHYLEMKQLVDEAVAKRAEVILLDYARDRVNSKMLIDGAWHVLPPQTRAIGDSILIGLKSLAGLNAGDRRSKQIGRTAIQLRDKKMDLEVSSLGTKTGERVQLKFIEKRKHDLTLPELGMWPEMIKNLIDQTATNGVVIISAPPRNGLTTMWRATLGSVDRITRDWVALADETDIETEVENVVMHRFKGNAGETAMTIMKKVLLSQPDALVIPDSSDSETIDKSVSEAALQDRTVVTRVAANSAAEALIRLYSKTGERAQFGKTVNCVTGQRLARRLCDTCKVPVRVQPQMIQKLGGDPRKIKTLYKHYVLPPVEQRIDENGKPIEMLPCKTCGGIGFIGRISVFEVINIKSNIREALIKQPKIDTIRKLATANGDKPMLQNGYRIALMGITTVTEIQRVMKG